MRFRIGFFIFLFVCEAGYGQVNPIVEDSIHRIPQIDIFDVIRKLTKKPIKPEIVIPLQGVRNLSLLPIVGYSPANGFVVGAAVSVTELLGVASHYMGYL